MSDSDSSVEVEVKAPEKVKRVRTAKQIEAQMKGFEKIKAMREAKAKEKGEKALVEKEKKAKAKEEWKQLKQKPPSEELVTKRDLESFMSQVQGYMKPQVVEKIVEKPVEKIIEKPIERVVERIVEKPAPPTAAQKLTGHALLDRLFFDK